MEKYVSEIIFKFSSVTGFSAVVAQRKIVDDSVMDKSQFVKIEYPPFTDDIEGGMGVGLGFHLHNLSKVDDEYFFKYYTIDDTDEERLLMQRHVKEIIRIDFLKLKKLCFLCNIDQE